MTRCQLSPGLHSSKLQTFLTAALLYIQWRETVGYSYNYTYSMFKIWRKTFYFILTVLLNPI